MGGRCYVYSDVQGVCVSGVCNGLAFKEGAWLEGVEHDGCEFLCVEALEEAIDKYGRPEIFNTDQGSQFTSRGFTGVLKREGIRISMDGKRSWMDNVFIERLWRSLLSTLKCNTFSKR